MHKVSVKKTVSACLSLFVGVAVMASPFEGHYDLSKYDDLASGIYDLDRQLLTVNSRHNVAGIYQVNTELDPGNMAEIHQIGGIGNRGMIWQSGFNHAAKIEQVDGSNNVARLAQSGSGHIANLLQDGGSGNVMTVQMLGNNARIDAGQIGATSSTLSVILNSRSTFSGNQTGVGNDYKITVGENTSVTFNQTGGQKFP